MSDALPPYNGNDMLGFMLRHEFRFAKNWGTVLGMWNIRNTAIIVTDCAVWRAVPDIHGAGFSIQLLAKL